MTITHDACDIRPNVAYCFTSTLLSASLDCIYQLYYIGPMLAWIRWLYISANIESCFIYQFEIEGKTDRRKEKTTRERKEKRGGKEIKKQGKIENRE